MRWVRRAEYAVRRRVRATSYWVHHRNDWAQSHRESNAQSKLPAGERVRLGRLWLVECFPPSRAASLVDRLERIAAEETIEDLGWVRQWREHAIGARGGGSYTGERRFIGRFVRDPDQFNEIYSPDLPPLVESAEAVIEWLSASLTIVTMEFLLAEAASERVNDVLGRDYRTVVVATRTDVTAVPPARRRARAVRLEMARVRQECTDWMRRNFPGAFAQGLLDGDMPSCLSLTLDVGQPLGRYEDVFDPFQFSVGVDGIDEAWESWLMPGYRLRVPIHHVDNPAIRRHWLLAGNYSDVFRDRDSDPAASDSYLNELSPIASLLAETIGIAGLLEGYQKVLARLGDGIGNHKPALPRPFRWQAELVRDLSMVARDVHPVVGELAHWHGPVIGPRADDTFVPVVGSFYSNSRLPSDVLGVVRVAASAVWPLRSPRRMWQELRFDTRKPKNLTEYWISLSQEEAKQLKNREESLHDVLGAHASIMAASATFRLTLVMAALTLLLAVGTALQIYLFLVSQK